MMLMDLFKSKGAPAEEAPEEPEDGNTEAPAPSAPEDAGSAAEEEPAEAPADSSKESSKLNKGLEKVSKFFSREKLVTLHTIEYVAYEGRYVDTIEEMKEEDLPPEALRIAGRKREWLSPRRLHFPAQNPNELTAADLYLFSLQNSLENVMTASGKQRAPLDARTIMSYAVIAIVAICILYALFA